MRNQQTIAAEATVAGVGYVTGADVTVRFAPAEADTGIVFIRTDLAGSPSVPAAIDCVAGCPRRTVLGRGGVTVQMTEHVLAALRGLEIDNALVFLDAGELPGMDGSASPFVAALRRAGRRELGVPRVPCVVHRTCRFQEGQAWIAAEPGPPDTLEITFDLDYSQVPKIGKQRFAVRLHPDVFEKELAPARTFVLEQEVAALRAQGLGPRATPRDLIVIGNDGRIIDNQWRFPDECVRHKILDLVGDLALAGSVHGRVTAHRSGHALNVQLAREIVRQAARSDGSRPETCRRGAA